MKKDGVNVFGCCNVNGWVVVVDVDVLVDCSWIIIMILESIVGFC